MLSCSEVTGEQVRDSDDSLPDTEEKDLGADVSADLSSDVETETGKVGVSKAEQPHFGLLAVHFSY